jgi:formate dehydrogenase major subunit
MGISQHTTGTDNARCLIALCSITGNVGPTGHRAAPAARAEQRAGRLGRRADPDVLPRLPGRRPRGRAAAFEEAWGTPLNPKRGLTVTEIIKSALQPDGVRGMYMLGENPFLSDPNINKVRKALSALDFLVVQDIFLTETAEFADVILPRRPTWRRTAPTPTPTVGSAGRKVMDPPGQARPDWEIVQDIARRIGLDWHYGAPE